MWSLCAQWHGSVATSVRSGKPWLPHLIQPRTCRHGPHGTVLGDGEWCADGVRTRVTPLSPHTELLGRSCCTLNRMSKWNASVRWKVRSAWVMLVGRRLPCLMHPMRHCLNLMQLCLLHRSAPQQVELIFARQQDLSSLNERFEIFGRVFSRFD